MGVGNSAGLQIGSVKVVTTHGTGLTVEHWTERLMERIVYVSDTTNPIIKQQAFEYQDVIRNAVTYYMQQAINSDRTTLYNLFIQQGHSDMAEILRRLP